MIFRGLVFEWTGLLFFNGVPKRGWKFGPVLIKSVGYSKDPEKKTGKKGEKP